MSGRLFRGKILTNCVTLQWCHMVPQYLCLPDLSWPWPIGPLAHGQPATVSNIFTVSPCASSQSVDLSKRGIPLACRVQRPATLYSMSWSETKWQNMPKQSKTYKTYKTSIISMTALGVIKQTAGKCFKGNCALFGRCWVRSELATFILWDAQARRIQELIKMIKSRPCSKWWIRSQVSGRRSSGDGKKMCQSLRIFDQITDVNSTVQDEATLVDGLLTFMVDDLLIPEFGLCTVDFQHHLVAKSNWCHVFEQATLRC